MAHDKLTLLPAGLQRGPCTSVGPCKTCPCASPVPHAPPACRTGELYNVGPHHMQKELDDICRELEYARLAKVQELAAAIQLHEPGSRIDPELRVLTWAGGGMKMEVDAVVVGPSRVYLAWYQRYVETDRCAAGGHIASGDMMGLTYRYVPCLLLQLKPMHGQMPGSQPAGCKVPLGDTPTGCGMPCLLLQLN